MSTLTPDQERVLYRGIVRTRSLDVELVRWQRQGIIPAYPPMIGQEAAQVGVASVVDRSRDLAFIMYRELGVAIALDADLKGYLANHIGDWNGGAHGSLRAGITPIQSVVGSNSPHAVGWALGQKLDKKDGVAVAFIGDGGTSQGDTHEAMNFAGVWNLPVVFFVTNNQWAISVPASKQIAGGSIAARAAGYGFPGVEVDGNDVLAVREAAETAFARARAGEGPTLIEAKTYRRGPHATSDDPGRYRTLEEERANAGEDPVDRYRASVLERGILDAAAIAEIDAETAVWLEDLRTHLVGTKPRSAVEIFDHVYDELTPDLVAQKAQLLLEEAGDE